MTLSAPLNMNSRRNRNVTSKKAEPEVHEVNDDDDDDVMFIEHIQHVVPKRKLDMRGKGLAVSLVTQSDARLAASAIPPEVTSPALSRVRGAHLVPPTTRGGSFMQRKVLTGHTPQFQRTVHSIQPNGKIQKAEVKVKVSWEKKYNIRPLKVVLERLDIGAFELGAKMQREKAGTSSPIVSNDNAASERKVKVEIKTAKKMKKSTKKKNNRTKKSTFQRTSNHIKQEATDESVPPITSHVVQSKSVRKKTPSQEASKYALRNHRAVPSPHVSTKKVESPSKQVKDEPEICTPDTNPPRSSKKASTTKSVSSPKHNNPVVQVQETSRLLQVVANCDKIISTIGIIEEMNLEKDDPPPPEPVKAEPVVTSTSNQESKPQLTSSDTTSTFASQSALDIWLKSLLEGPNNENQLGGNREEQQFSEVTSTTTTLLCDLESESSEDVSSNAGVNESTLETDDVDTREQVLFVRAFADVKIEEGVSSHTDSLDMPHTPKISCVPDVLETNKEDVLSESISETSQNDILKGEEDVVSNTADEFILEANGTVEQHSTVKVLEVPGEEGLSSNSGGEKFVPQIEENKADRNDVSAGNIFEVKLGEDLSSNASCQESTLSLGETEADKIDAEVSDMDILEAEEGDEDTSNSLATEVVPETDKAHEEVNTAVFALDVFEETGNESLLSNSGAKESDVEMDVNEVISTDVHIVPETREKEGSSPWAGGKESILEINRQEPPDSNTLESEINEDKSNAVERKSVLDMGIPCTRNISAVNETSKDDLLSKAAGTNGFVFETNQLEALEENISLVTALENSVPELNSEIAMHIDSPKCLPIPDPVSVDPAVEKNSQSKKTDEETMTNTVDDLNTTSADTDELVTIMNTLTIWRVYKCRMCEHRLSLFYSQLDFTKHLSDWHGVNVISVRCQEKMANEKDDPAQNHVELYKRTFEENQSQSEEDSDSFSETDYWEDLSDEPASDSEYDSAVETNKKSPRDPDYVPRLDKSGKPKGRPRKNQDLEDNVMPKLTKPKYSSPRVTTKVHKQPKAGPIPKVVRRDGFTIIHDGIKRKPKYPPVRVQMNIPGGQNKVKVPNFEPEDDEIMIIHDGIKRKPKFSPMRPQMNVPGRPNVLPPNGVRKFFSHGASSSTFKPMNHVPRILTKVPGWQNKTPMPYGASKVEDGTAFNRGATTSKPKTPLPRILAKASGRQTAPPLPNGTLKDEAVSVNTGIPSKPLNQSPEVQFQPNDLPGLQNSARMPDGKACEDRIATIHVGQTSEPKSPQPNVSAPSLQTNVPVTPPQMIAPASQTNNSVPTLQTTDVPVPSPQKIVSPGGQSTSLASHEPKLKTEDNKVNKEPYVCHLCLMFGNTEKRFDQLCLLRSHLKYDHSRLDKHINEFQERKDEFGNILLFPPEEDSTVPEVKIPSDHSSHPAVDLPQSAECDKAKFKCAKCKAVVENEDEFKLHFVLCKLT